LRTMIKRCFVLVDFKSEKNETISPKYKDT